MIFYLLSLPMFAFFWVRDNLRRLFSRKAK